MCVCAHTCARTETKRIVRSPRIGVTGSCEPPDMVAGPKLGSSGTTASALNKSSLQYRKDFFNSVYV